MASHKTAGTPQHSGCAWSPTRLWARHSTQAAHGLLRDCGHATTLRLRVNMCKPHAYLYHRTCFWILAQACQASTAPSDCLQKMALEPQKHV
jgi:hypothetical protein